MSGNSALAFKTQIRKRKDFKHVFCSDYNVCEACPYMEECFDQAIAEVMKYGETSS